MRYFFILFVITLHTSLIADGIALIEDDEQRLFVFDKGDIEHLEHNQIIQKHTGKYFAAYIDYMNSLKVWHNNHLKTISESIEHFVGSEELIVWEIANYLYVWQDGIKKEISRDARLVKVKGSMVFFEDEYDNALKIYYDHKVYHFATNYYSLRTKALQMGHKSLAVQDGQDQLFVFVKGKMQMQKFTQDRLIFNAGNNGVLVVNDDTGALQLITGNDVVTIDYFAPRWINTEYGWIVWQDNTGNFYLWKNQQKKLLTYQKPAELKFSPKAMLYENGKQLYIETTASSRMVCDHIPETFDFYNQLFVFLNRQGLVEVVDHNQHKVISATGGAKFELYYDVVIIYEGRKRKVYHNGRIYNI